MHPLSEYFAKETGVPCVMNIWTGDGFKDVPADRMGPRLRYKDSIEQILSEPYDRKLGQAVRGIQGIRYRRGVLHRGFGRIYVEFRRTA